MEWNLRSPRQFTKEDLLSFSQGDSQNLVYDISRLNPRDFLPLIQGVERYGHNHLFSLTFTLDYYYEYCWIEYPNLKTNTIKKKQVKNLIPFTLANSAYKKIPNSIHMLTSMFTRLLPITITLSTLKFRSILFSQRDKDRLFSSLNRNSSVRKLCFENVNLGDDGFANLVNSIKHPGITTLECRQCGLTDDSVSAVSEFLTYHMLLQLKAEKDDDNYLKLVCLRTLDFRDNSFTTKLLSAITDILCDLPISLIDLRNNSDFDEKLLSSMRRTSPHCEIRTGLDKNTLSKKNNDQLDDKSEMENGEEIELLPDVRIKGNRAKEFVSCLEKIITLGEELAKIQQLYEQEMLAESRILKSSRSSKSPTPPRSPSSGIGKNPFGKASAISSPRSTARSTHSSAALKSSRSSHKPPMLPIQSKVNKSYQSKDKEQSTISKQQSTRKSKFHRKKKLIDQRMNSKKMRKNSRNRRNKSV